MTREITTKQSTLTHLHRNILATAAILSVALIAMGGVLCVTGSIRSCPDWPGCFDKLYPPLALSPVLEYLHRILAALTGLSVFSTAVIGLVRTRNMHWLVIPPVVASLLVVLVSFFGALVVLRGLAPGWAAVDLGAALLVVALMVSSSVYAFRTQSGEVVTYHFSLRTKHTVRVWAAISVIYLTLISGVLVAGKNAVIGCIGWPIYSPLLYQQSTYLAGNILRLALSVIGLLIFAAVLIQARRQRVQQPGVYHISRCVSVGLLAEFILQALILLTNFNVYLLILYTIDMAVVWALLILLGMRASLEPAALGK